MDEAAENESQSGNRKVPLLPYGFTSCSYLGLDDPEEELGGYFLFEGATKKHITSVHILMEAKPYNIYTLSDDDLGQILDYVCAVWNSQPTRLFVPVVLLHDKPVDLLVFTRSGWYRCSFGQLCRNSPIDNGTLVDKAIERTMISLWFLLTLPTNKFGHFCKRKDSLTYLTLTHKGREVLADAEAFGFSEDPRSVCIEDPISTQKVLVNGRMVHLYETTYENKPVFLKLSWTRINRYPEGSVYGVLDHFGVEGIPEVYDSGIIEQNIFGYRVEYLMLEDCGPTVDKYLGGLSDESYACAQAQKFLSQVAPCLVEASHYGISYRDVSAGNIAIKDGKAKLIDWGYRILMGDCFNRYPELADEWKFDKETELREQYYDRKIGCYNIQVSQTCILG